MKRVKSLVFKRLAQISCHSQATHLRNAGLEISVAHQEQLAVAVKRADGKRFQVPDGFARSMISQAFLGQLDVNPLGDVPGSRNDHRRWAFTRQTIYSGQPEITRVRLEGESSIEGGQDRGGNLSRGGRLWEHRVTLKWQGYADVKDNRIIQLVMIANGDEQLRWGNARFNFPGKYDASHLMAGHPIDLECVVRYGLVAKPCSADEVVEGPLASRPGPGRGPGPELRAKMQRLQVGMKRLRQSGGNPSEIAQLMKNFGLLMRQQKLKEAEALLDEALKLLE